MKFCKPSDQVFHHGLLVQKPLVQGTAEDKTRFLAPLYSLVTSGDGHLHDNKPMFQMGIHLEFSEVARPHGQSQYVLDVFGKSTSRM